MDLETLYEKLDELWPNPRTLQEKTAERKALAEVAVDEGAKQRVLDLVGIYVTDKKPNRLPGLVQLILTGERKATRRPIVSNPVTDIPPSTPSKNEEVEALFVKLISVWPSNEHSQKESTARQAFYTASRLKSLEDIALACTKYIHDMADPRTASVHYFGMRRFLEDWDIFDRWLSKAKAALNTASSEHFEAAYAWYPDFIDKGDESTRADSLVFYNRWVKDEEVVDFFFAVKAYAKQVRFEETEIKFVKKFANFIRVWKKQAKWEQLAELSEPGLIHAFRSRNIPYDCVYFGEHHLNAIKYLCLQANAEKEEIGIAAALTKHVENIHNYLASGANYTGTVWTAPIDYSIVTEVMQNLRKEAAKLP